MTRISQPSVTNNATYCSASNPGAIPNNGGGATTL
jgi:hypothetical protein